MTGPGFEPRRPGPWDSAYATAGGAPWDIGRPQAVFVRLADEAAIRGPVLDSGCGTGEHAPFLAGRGLEVVGVDHSPLAIDRARAKAEARGIEAAFLVHDVLDLGSLGRRFASVVDSGVFHVFDDADRARYVSGLHAVLAPGGTLHLLCFSDREPGEWGPRRIGVRELRAAFRDGWSVASIEPATFETIPSMADARAWLARIVRA